MLNDKSQLQKATYFMLYSYEISRIGKSTETENRLEVARGWKEEGLGKWLRR